MMPRDKLILSNLNRFRVMSRDDIADIHFSHTRHPVTQANLVLKRMRRDGYVEVSTERRKYLYFSSPSPIKKDSQKINHFLRFVEFYRSIRKIEEPRYMEIEPKYGKGNPEPDLFILWMKAPAFVEIQRSVYSEKQIKEKMERYERYFYSDEWHSFSWQPKEKKIFPRVWIIGEQRFNWEPPFKLVQTRTVEEISEVVKR